MKALFILLLSSLTAFGQAFTLQDAAFVHAALGQAAAAPAAPDFSESFEASGYDNTGWAVTGTTVDPDYALPGTPPGALGSYGCRLTSGGTEFHVHRDMGAGKTAMGGRFYFYVATMGADGTACTLMSFCQNAYWNIAAAFQLSRLGSQARIQLIGTGTSSWDVTSSAWHYVDWHATFPSGTIYAKVDGAGELDEPTENLTPRYIALGGLAQQATAWDFTVDLVQWSYTDAYLP